MTLLSSVQQWWNDRTTSAFHHVSDSELLLRFSQQAESSALDTLISRHCDPLYHYLISLSDAQIAEDISQQVWLKLVEKPHSYQNQHAQFRTWLFCIARNRLVDELRRQDRWQWSSLESLTDDSDDGDDELTFKNNDDIAQQFDNALTNLPFAQREAIMLQLDGFSLISIAEITAEKTETIKSRLRFARKHLKNQLGAAHD